MQLGMYTEELSRPDPETLFRDIRAMGFTQAQFNFLSVGEDELPSNISPTLIRRIRGAADAAGVSIVAVNGTFNMVDPDPDRREDGLRRFEEVAKQLHGLGCRLMTLCTGSRNPQSMWRWSEENATQSAWDDLLVTMQVALRIADTYDVDLALECEASNVMNTMQRCRQILDVFNSPRLKVIMDVANLFQPGEARRENVHDIMKRAFDLLGPEVVLAHGKDIREGEGLDFTYAGNGIVDFKYFRALLDGIGYRGCMLLHGIHDESEFPKAVKHVKQTMK